MPEPKFPIIETEIKKIKNEQVGINQINLNQRQ